MLNWLTPNSQKAIAIGFVIIWFAAEGRLTAFWQAMSGDITIK